MESLEEGGIQGRKAHLSINGFVKTIAVWQAIVDECAALRISITQNYLYQQPHYLHFQLEVAGDWHQLAKLERQLSVQQKGFDSESFLFWERTILASDKNMKLPYLFEVVAVTEILILNILVSFIQAAKSVEIREIILDQFIQPKTIISMQKIRVLVYLPFIENIPDLRENFMIFCEQYHVDGMFELDRN